MTGLRQPFGDIEVLAGSEHGCHAREVTHAGQRDHELAAKRVPGQRWARIAAAWRGGVAGEEKRPGPEAAGIVGVRLGREAVTGVPGPVSSAPATGPSGPRLKT